MTRQPPPAGNTRAGMPIAYRLFALAALAMLSAGCSVPDYLNEVYGMRSRGGADSVNGTAVLAEMFEAAGHDVRSWRLMSPSLEKADVIVWFPDDFETPSADAIVWLEEWLFYNDSAKTLIFVSRDYDAGELYWRSAKPMSPAPQQPEFAKRLGSSKASFAQQRGSAPAGELCSDWFTLDRRNPKRKVKGLAGPWASGVDASKAAIEHRRFVQPGDEADILLADGKGHALVSEVIYEFEDNYWNNPAPDAGDSRIIVVENGSFLLNAALINHEHRKLAGKLVDHVGQPELDVVFLESDASPLVQDEDPSEGPPTGFRLFGVWPIGGVLAQLAALGLVFAAARWPIFGVPRKLDQPSLTDFGRHVTALGRLLAATRDRAYAYAQLRAYFQAGAGEENHPAAASSQQSK
ncbi:MAG: hypothetical protein AAF589_02115 [Planctomycetota bacterium]